MKNETIDFVFRVKNTDNLFNTAAGDKHSHFCSQGLFLGLKKLQPLFFVNTNMTDVPPRYAHCVNMCREYIRVCVCVTHLAR